VANPTIASPQTSTSEAGTIWTKVLGRKERTAAAKAGKKAATTAQPAAAKTRRDVMPAPPRPPTTSAITVNVPAGSNVNIAEVMGTLKTRIGPAEFGLDAGVRPRRAATGGLVLEIAGPDRETKADLLANRMREILADTDAIIVRPVKCGELRVLDLDESITPLEIAAAVAEAGGCSTADVKVGDIKPSPKRLGTEWVRCPLGAIRKISSVKKLRVGWISVRVEPLAPRPLQCYRCLELGHVRAKCPNNATDRSGRCFACGEIGHKASACVAKTHRCPVCSDLGRPADHRLGSKKCSPPKKKKGVLMTPALATASLDSPPTPEQSQSDGPTEEAMKA
jgi:hypothetical protein